MIDTDLEKIHREFVAYGKNAREWLLKCQLLLPLVAEGRIWEKKKFSSIYEYASKLSGMSRSAVDNALWVLRKVKDKPALQEVVELKGINRVKAVASIATPETASFLAEKARTMSVHTLETYVRETKKVLHVEKIQSDGFDVTVNLSFDLSRRLEVLKKHRNFKACFEGKFERLLDELEQEFELEKPAAVRTLSRHIPVPTERYVRARFSGLCAYPGCTRLATSLHHTQRWGLEKIHDPDRLHALCTGHERLAHLGLIENEEAAPKEWHIRENPALSAAQRVVERCVGLYRPT
jgi:hypothetical protein